MIRDNIKDLRLFATSRGIDGNTFDEYHKYNFRGGYIEPTVIEQGTNNMSVISVYSRLLMERQIFLGTEINSDVANIVTAQLLWLEQQGNSEVQLLLNTPGGSVHDGLQIIDVMDFISPKVSTTVVGMAASMGAVIASSGEKGMRYILPHARFMVHQVMGGAHGQCSDVQIQYEQMKLLQDELYEILSRNSGMDIGEITKMADRDKWMTASEAIDNGFIDKIVEKGKK